MRCKQSYHHFSVVVQVQTQRESPVRFCSYIVRRTQYDRPSWRYSYALDVRLFNSDPYVSK